jgi:hypothetical protein
MHPFREIGAVSCIGCRFPRIRWPGRPEAAQADTEAARAEVSTARSELQARIAGHEAENCSAPATKRPRRSRRYRKPPGPRLRRPPVTLTPGSSRPGSRPGVRIDQAQADAGLAHWHHATIVPKASDDYAPAPGLVLRGVLRRASASHRSLKTGPGCATAWHSKVVCRKRILQRHTLVVRVQASARLRSSAGLLGDRSFRRSWLARDTTPQRL